MVLIHTSRPKFGRYGTIVILCGGLFGVMSIADTAFPAGIDIPLFTDLPAPLTQPAPLAQASPRLKSSRPWIKRQRSMRINPAGLDSLSQSAERTRVVMSLFDATTHRLELQPPRGGPNRSRIWRGRFQNEPGSDVSLVAHGTTLVGTMLSDHRLYKIESTGEGEHQLVELDLKALPEDHHPIVVPDSAADVTAPPGAAPADTSAPTALEDDGSQVDLLVVYTPAARIREGGQVGIEALISLGVDLANQAYDNSLISLQLRLVHTEEIAYAEAGDISSDLSRLRSTTDGVMDRVHQLRDQYKADLVALVVDDGGGGHAVSPT